MKYNLKNSILLLMLLMVALIATSCKDDNDKPNPTPPETSAPFHIVMASGSGSQSTTILQATDNVTSGTISFKGKGFTIATKRAPHLGFGPGDHENIYYLNYRESTIHKLKYDPALPGQYKVAATTLDPSKEYGQGLRFKVITDKIASAHEAIGKMVKGKDGKMVGQTIFNVMMVNLEPFNINMTTRKLNMEVVLPNEISGSDYYVITRADSPLIEGNKIYYGVNIGKFDPNKPSGSAAGTNKTATLILDYPSLDNPKVILHPEELGATNGYRTQTMYAAEDGGIYQMASTRTTTVIVKIKNGKYDTSFKYDLTKLLGVKGTRAYGWFYTGKGIGYIPFENQDYEQFQRGVDPQGNPTYSAQYGIARMDFNKNSVVNLEVPQNMWLHQYQTVAIRDGKIHFALAPFDKPGHVYIFDTKSESPVGTKGAVLEQGGADQYYIGMH